MFNKEKKEAFSNVLEEMNLFLKMWHIHNIMFILNINLYLFLEHFHDILGEKKQVKSHMHSLIATFFEGWLSV